MEENVKVTESLAIKCLELAIASSPQNSVDIILENAEKYKKFVIKSTS